MMHSRLLVATGAELLAAEPGRGVMTRLDLPAEVRPTCVAAAPGTGRAWCGTDQTGVYRTDDGGESWRPAGLPGRRIMSLAVGRAAGDEVWAGTEPSEVWRSTASGDRWERTRPLETLASSSEWAFPPRPETHYVRWITAHPEEPGRLWVAIEAGALVSTRDAGRSWHDRVAGGPRDTHELAVHPDRPDGLRVAAGDGYFESDDGGATWRRPREGLEVDYLRSVAIDPGDPATVLVSAASRPRAAYVAGRADGRLYRRAGGRRWERIHDGWPDPPDTIAPLLLAGAEAGELWAADERGLHGSADGGVAWERVAAFPRAPTHLRGLARL